MSALFYRDALSDVINVLGIYIAYNNAINRGTVFIWFDRKIEQNMANVPRTDRRDRSRVNIIQDAVADFVIMSRMSAKGKCHCATHIKSLCCLKQAMHGLRKCHCVNKHKIVVMFKTNNARFKKMPLR